MKTKIVFRFFGENVVFLKSRMICEKKILHRGADILTKNVIL